MMKEAKPFVQGYVYAQRVECEEPCEGETPSLYSTSIPQAVKGNQVVYLDATGHVLK